MIVSILPFPGPALYVTAHEAVPTVAVGERLQLVELNTPVPLVLQVTVPVGVIGVPADVSLTITVHVVVFFGCTVLGEQLTLVEVSRFVTIMLVVL